MERPLVENFVARKEITVLASPPGRKTTLLQDLALA